MTEYKRGPHPRYKVGDPVISFRGETGVVTAVYESRHWRTKSHRIEVRWANELNNPDRRAYYEEVFEPHASES